MMAECRWTLPFPFGATTNHLYRHFGKVILSENAMAWRDEILVVMRQQERAPALRGYVAVTLTAYVPDHRRRDVSNLEKFLTDTIFRELGMDDSRIVDYTLAKRWHDGPPQLVVTVCEADYQGETLAVGEPAAKRLPPRKGPL